MKNSSLISKILIAAVTLGIPDLFRRADLPLCQRPHGDHDGLYLSGGKHRGDQRQHGASGAGAGRATAADLMQLRRSEGERVSSGGAVATVYADQASLDRQNEIETLNNRIDQLEYAQESMLGAEVTLKLDSQIVQSTAGLPLCRSRRTDGHGGESRAGATGAGAETGLHILRHGGSQRTASGAAGLS